MTPLPRPSVDGLVLTRAQPADLPAIQSLVNQAYSKYIPRIGKPPAPMTADYAVMLETHGILVLRTADDTNGDAGRILGSIVLSRPIPAGSLAGGEQDHEELKINNLVVSPAAQGRGYGRVLVDYAEEVARAQGSMALTLFTNVKMIENVGLYTKLGFEEVDRRTGDGYERVYFRKSLDT